MPQECLGLVEWDLDSMKWATENEVTISEDGGTYIFRYSMDEGVVTVPGKQSLTLVLKVGAAPNGLKIAPKFRVNLYGNTEEDKKDVEYMEDVQQLGEIQVSASSKFDIELRNLDKVISTDDGKRKVYVYGLAFKVLGDNEEKGIRGIEKPTGPLTFDIDYKLTKSATNITNNNLFLYNYKYNIREADSLGDENNDITGFPNNSWMNLGYPYSFNSGAANKKATVYQNGNLKMVDNGADENGNGKITVTIENYDMTAEFPDRIMGSATSSIPKNVGYVSCGIFYMGVEKNDITMAEGIESEIRLEATNLNVNTIGGAECNTDQDLTNNVATGKFTPHVTGEFDKEVHIYSYEDEKILATPREAGNASAYLNSKVQINSRIEISNKNEIEDWIHGVDSLLKFDDTVLEPILNDTIDETKGKYSEYGVNGDYGLVNMTFNILYATKQDGTGWLNDDEMNSATMEDLVYYDHLDEIPEGHVCVAVLAESQSGVVKSGINLRIKSPFRVKSDAEVNKVAQVVTDVRVYNEGNAPDRNKHSHLITNNKEDFPTPRWDSEKSGATYVKSEYDEYGKVIAGTHVTRINDKDYYGYIAGNSLLVLSAKQEIAINAIDDNDKEKNNYDIGKNENKVKYVITPRLTLAPTLTTVDSVEGINLRVESILPKGITYVEGSCKDACNYDEPEVIQNEDGTTVLVWYIKDCSTKDIFEQIVYLAHISEESEHNQSYDVKAIISEIVGEDGISKIGNNDVAARTANKTIKITNLLSYTLYKTAEEETIETDGKIHYKIVFLNRTDNDIKDFRLLDILPYNGDDRGSNFTGTYAVENITLNQVITTTSEVLNDNSNLSLYISNDESARSANVKDENLGTSSIWTNQALGEAINKELTATAVIGTLSPRVKLELDIVLSTKGNEAGEVYNNSATAQTNISTEAIQTPIVKVDTTRNDLTYTVNYLEKDNETNVLHQPKVVQNQTYLAEVDVKKEIIEIDGYVFDSISPEDKLTIQITGNVINIYYTRRMDLSYKVNYLEKGTNKVLKNPKIVTDQIFETVIESSKEKIDIYGYEYDSADKESITIGTIEDKNVINLYYIIKDASVLVHHYKEGTTEKVGEDVLKPYKVGQEYTTEVGEDIPEYYELVKEPDNKTGVTTEEQTVVIYYYKFKEYGYEVNYLEKGTNKPLSSQKQGEAKEYGTEISTLDEVIEIDGYDLDSTDPEEKLIIQTSGNVINIYYVKKSDLIYTVNYLEKDNESNILHEAKVAKNQVFGDIIESEDEIIEIPGYTYDSADKKSITIVADENENVINLYYMKRTDLTYTVRYLEKNTDKELHDEKTVGSQSFGDVIESENEKIEIEGYHFYELSPEKLVITENENIINIYYVKRTDLSYTVNYLEKDTNKILHQPRIVENQKYESIINSSDEIIEIDGYEYDSVNIKTLIISVDDNIINIYYTKKTDLSYTVNYLEKGNESNILHEAKVAENQTFGDTIIAEDEKIDIYGYNYDSTDVESIVIGTGENVINVYYTKKDTSVLVHYYKEGTTERLSNDVTIPGKVFSEYEAPLATDIPSKYELVKVPENAKGEMTEEQIVVTYYYRLKPAKLIVHYYYDNNGEIIKVSETIIDDTKRFDDVYETQPADDVPIKYELIATPENATGIIDQETVTVIYYYKVKDTSVIVRYLEEGTNIELAPPDMHVKKVEEDYDYSKSAKEIENYKLVRDSGNTTGRCTIEPITVIFYYSQKTRVVTKHIDKATGELLEEPTIDDGVVGDTYKTTPKNFKYYILTQPRPENETGIMTKDEIVVEYYYERPDAKIIEKHIDILNKEGEPLYEGVISDKQVGDSYDVPSRTFEWYDLVEEKLPENSKGIISSEEPIEVIYYYIHRATVTVEYIDKVTGEKLIKEDIVKKGHEGDEYTTERKQIDGYVLTEEPSNADGIMTKEPIKVTYYYVHLTGGVIERHIDIMTDTQLIPEEKTEGYEGETYKTEPENIPYYDLVEEKYPENSEGIRTIEQIIVNYYYIKQSEVNVKYVDKATGKEIEKPKNIPGHEGDEYTTESKEIPGYDLIEIPENKDGKMTKEPIEVIYYYLRPAKVIVRHIDIETEKLLIEEEEPIEGHEGDLYETEEKEIQYYILEKAPENAKGKMKVEITKDEDGEEVVDNITYVNYYYRKKIFNLSIDKKVGSVIINGVEKTVNSDLGKVEIHRKQLATANIQVVYTIVIKNDSELSGKAKLLEIIPKGMVMQPEKNKEWKISDRTAVLETTEIKPGESLTYKVVLDWAKEEGNVGTKENIAQISSTDNEAGFVEKDTTDNIDMADLIVAVGTGDYTYVSGKEAKLLIISTIALIVLIAVTGVIAVKKKNKE